MAKGAPVAPNLALTGDVEARHQSQIAFRIDGKIVRRFVDVGAHITKDEVLAEIDPDQRKSDLSGVEAQVRSSQATLDQAQDTFRRQSDLLRTGFTTQASYAEASKTLRTAQAQRDAVVAQADSAKKQLGYTALRAGIDGIVTQRDAEVGQVVKAGDTVFTIAQDGPRDAVFTVYEALLVDPPEDKRISVMLQSDPSVRATATVREISPTVDSKTGGVKLKATIDDPPPRMTLGSTVVGLGTIGTARAVTLPWSALFRWQGQPAVWIVGADGTATPHGVTIDRFDDSGMILKDGVEPGQRVVKAGVQFLRPGDPVEIAPDGTP